MRAPEEFELVNYVFKIVFRFYTILYFFINKI